MISLEEKISHKIWKKILRNLRLNLVLCLHLIFFLRTQHMPCSIEWSKIYTASDWQQAFIALISVCDYFSFFCSKEQRIQRDRGKMMRKKSTDSYILYTAHLSTAQLEMHMDTSETSKFPYLFSSWRSTSTRRQRSYLENSLYYFQS